MPDAVVATIGFTQSTAERGLEQYFRPEGLVGSCVPCSAATPHHCHRRVMREYLNEKWYGALTVRHL